MKKTFLAALAALLLLAGCAQTLATVSAQGTYLLGASIDYVHRVHEKRRSLEELCWQSVMREIDAVRKAGGSEAAVRAILLKSYPKPVTLALLDKIRNDPNSILARPPGCPVEEPPAEAPTR